MGKVNKILFTILLFAVFALAGAPVLRAQEKINIKEIVFEHLADAYEWHIVTVGEHHVSLPLPVIVRSANGQWHVFLSSQLAHGRTYRGFRIAHDGKYVRKIVTHSADGQEIRPLDLSITKNVFALWINGGLLLLLILPLARWYRRRGALTVPPKGLRGAVEMTITFVVDEVIRPSIGADYRKYTTYLLTVFFLILTINLTGLVPFFPGGVNLTGNIAVTLFLAVCTFLVISFAGTRTYWKDIFWPDVPTWLKVPLPIMPIIEFFGIFTKPFALMIRLFANIMAGHSVILGLVCLIFITASMGVVINTGMSVVAVLFSLFMNCLELLVAFIQAYVFTLLSAVFIGMARIKHEAHENLKVEN